MTFEEFRKDVLGWNDKVNITRPDGKNLIKETYTGADFDEDEHYTLDDYEVVEVESKHGLGVHWVTLRKG